MRRAAANEETADLRILAEEAPDHASRLWARALEPLGTASGSVFLFSGLMVDRPDAPSARFPAMKEAAIAAAIDRTLASAGAGAGDRAVSGAACGGDVLFAEAALRRGLILDVYLPSHPEQFIAESVERPSGEWVERFHDVLTNARTVHVMPDAIGTGEANKDRHERNNRWMVHAATTGPAEVHLILVWDGDTGSGRGGTAHMHDLARPVAVRTTVIDPNDLEVT